MYTLYNGDCLEVMKTLPNNSINLILCDLPYNITGMNWDTPVDLEKLWQEYNRILKNNSNIVLFSSGIFTYKLYESNPTQYKYKIIWKKNVPTGMSSAKYRPMKYYEEILIFQKGVGTYNPQMKDRVGKHKECYNYDHYCGENNHLPDMKKINKRYDPNKVQPSDIVEFNVVPNRKGKLHPTQKSVELLQYLIQTYSNSGDVVLDNCMGSGSTGEACIFTERDFIGIEIDEKYFNVANNRLTSSNLIFQGETKYDENRSYKNIRR